MKHLFAALYSLLLCAICAHAQCESVLRQTLGSALALHRDGDATRAYTLADSAWRVRPSAEVFARLCEAAYFGLHPLGDSTFGSPLYQHLGQMTTRIGAAALSTDHRWVISGDVLGGVWLWDIAQRTHYALDPASAGAVQFQFSPDGTHVLGLFRDNTFRVWNIVRGSDFGKERTFGLGSSTALNGGTWLNNELFALAEGSGRYIPSQQLIEIFTIDGTLVRQVIAGENRVERIATQMDSSFVLAFCADSVLRRYDFAGEKRDSFPLPDFRRQLPNLAARYFLQKSERDLFLYHAAAFPVPTFDLPFAVGLSDNIAPTGDWASFQGNIVSVRDRQGNTLFTLSAHEDMVSAVQFVPTDKGYEILTAAMDKKVRLWTQQGSLLRTFSLPNVDFDFIARATLSPDHTWLAAVTGFSTVAPRASDGYIWNIVSGQPPIALAGHEQNITQVCFSPDGKQLLTASEDGSARLWTLKGNALRTLKDHTGAVSVAFFLPNGNIFTASQTEGVVHNAQGEAIVRIAEPFIQAAVYSPDYGVLFTAASEGISGWDLQGNRLFKLPCTQVTRLLLAPHSQWLISASFEGVLLWNFASIAKIVGSK